MAPIMSTLLVVDDDAALRVMYSRSLASLGTVEQADGGRQALQLLDAHRYAAIVLDLHMPGVDGFAVLEVIARDDHCNRDTPVFVVTGDTSEQARVRALKLRSLFLLTKPVPLVMLKSLVETSMKKVAGRPPSDPARPTRKV
jgi:CheY-like chemotaxis protein